MYTTVKNEIYKQTFQVGSQNITVSAKFKMTAQIIPTPTGRQLEGMEVEIEEMECHTFWWDRIDIWAINDDDWTFVKSVMNGLRDAVRQHVLDDIRFYFLGECD